MDKKRVDVLLNLGAELAEKVTRAADSIRAKDEDDMRVEFHNIRIRIVTAVAALFLFVATPTGADEVLLDDQDCVDWARTFDSIVWKQKGSALGARSLLKFDLTDLGPVQLVNQAVLQLYIERGQPGTTLEVYHVHDDGWSYRFTDSDAIYNWPRMELVASVDASDTLTVTLDVTSQVIEDLVNAGDRMLSIKLESTPDHAGIRVASPLAPRWSTTPRLHVSFQSPDPQPLPPDLTLSTGDIVFDPMQPSPGGSVALSARVRNNSATASSPTTVEFWDGPPGMAGSVMIGVSSLPSLAPGGGAALVQTTWGSAHRGLHDVHVVVDRDGLVAESDESNNDDSRQYLVSDEYEVFFESFEYAGRNEYFTDFEFPAQFGLQVPKPAFLERSGAVSCHGDYHLEAIVDGTADDGTVWIERALPVEPWSSYNVRCDWREFRYESDIAFPAVVAIGILDPEMEADFTFLGIPPEGGCRPWSYEQVIDTGPYDHVWVAFGFSITWESPGILGLDSVYVELERIAESGIEQPSRPIRLLGPIPNPTPFGADFLMPLPERARVEVGIYDVRGRLVRRLFDGYDGPGQRRFHWDGRTSSGVHASQGVYFITFRADGQTVGNRKVVIVR